MGKPTAILIMDLANARRVRAPNVTKIQRLDRASGLPLDFL